MVAVFVICQCFTIGADAYELICTLGGYKQEQTLCDANIYVENLINVAHFMLVLNSSVNFIFYMMNIDEFRRNFVKVSYQNNNFQFHVPDLIDKKERRLRFI